MEITFKLNKTPDSSSLNHYCSIAGSLLLLVGPFTPLVSLPIFGSVTLFQRGEDGTILFLVAIMALALSVNRRYGFLWVSGLLGLFEMGSLFYVLNERMSDHEGSPMARALSHIGPDWGVAVILLGSLLSLRVAISAGVRRRPGTIVARDAPTAHALVNHAAYDRSRQNTVVCKTCEKPLIEGLFSCGDCGTSVSYVDTTSCSFCESCGSPKALDGVCGKCDANSGDKQTFIAEAKLETVVANRGVMVHKGAYVETTSCSFCKFCGSPKALDGVCGKCDANSGDKQAFIAEAKLETVVANRGARVHKGHNSSVWRRAGLWVSLGAAALLCVVGLIVFRMRVERVEHQQKGLLPSLDSKKSYPIKAVESATSSIDATNYVGRMPDADFFNDPKIKSALDACLPPETVRGLEELDSRHVDFENVQAEGQILSVEWNPRVGTAVSGSILAVDRETRGAILAEQVDEPIIHISGKYQSTDTSKMPHVVSEWLQARSEAQFKLGQVRPSLQFLTYSGGDLFESFKVAGITDPTDVERFMAALRSAIADENKEAVSHLVSYPFIMFENHQARKIAGPAEFLENYSSIVNSRIKTTVALAGLGDLSANREGVRLGNGEVVFATSDSGQLLVTGINPDIE